MNNLINLFYKSNLSKLSPPYGLFNNKSLFQDAKTWKLVELKFRAPALINYKQLQNKFKIKHKTN